MRVEDRTGVMKPNDKTPNIIFICEHETESRIVDLLGKPGDRVTGELHLSDGYCEFYVRLGPYVAPGPTEFTNNIRQFIIKKTAVEGVESTYSLLKEYGRYLIQALERIDSLAGTINEALEMMDEEPAKEILRKAVCK